MIVKRIKLTRQPQKLIGIDWSNPITRGLVVCTVYGVDLVGIYRSIGAPQPVTRILPYRSGHGFGVASFASANISSTLSGTEFTTDKLLFKSDSCYAQLVFWNTSDRFCGLNIEDYNFSIRYSAADYSSRRVDYSTSLINDKVSFVQARVDCAADNNELWVDGTLATPSNTLGTAQSSFSIPSLSQITTHTGGSATALDRFWLRRLSDAELRSLQINPWQIFAPISRRIWVPDVSAGGGSTYAAPHIYTSRQRVVRASRW